MRVLDFRITLFGATFFLRLLCQYPGVFYFLMLSGSLPGFDLFSLSIATTRKKPIGFRELIKFFSFQRWKLKYGGM